MNRKALGRGLGALLSSDSTIDLGAEPSEVEIDSIVPGPMQPRTHFDEASLESLADSIRAHGIVQPLLVRRRDGGYELIAGERRWRAAKLAGISRVPVVVKEVADDNLLEIALIENIQRENLNPIEEAQAYQKLIETVGLTQEALASRVGRDRSYITNYLRLLRLPEDVQQLVKEGANLFSAPNGVNQIAAAADTGVQQGFIEKSNVSGVAEMSRMMEVMRVYSQLASLTQQQGDLRKSAI